jgi:hypothetical protein
MGFIQTQGDPAPLIHSGRSTLLQNSEFILELEWVVMVAQIFDRGIVEQKRSRECGCA